MSVSRRVVLLLAAVFSLLAAQPRTVVFEFEPIMVDSGITKVITSLLRDRLSDTKAFTVVNPTPGTRIYNIDPAESLARTLSAEKLVMGSVTRLGMKFLVAYKLVDVATGTVVVSDRATAESETEFDVLTDRIARAMKEAKPYAATLEMGGVITSEEKEPRARQPYSSILFNTGYTIPLTHQMPYDPGRMLFTLDAAVTYEAPTFLAEGQMGIMRGKNGFTNLHFEMLAHRLFSGKDVAPYLGGGLGVHRLKFQPEYPLPQRESDGLSLAVSGGALLFRTYYFRALVGAKASVLFSQDFGVIPMANINFGLTSPGFGPEGTVRTPPACIYGTLGAFFVTGLIVALTSM
jgi:TolB-like protein